MSLILLAAFAVALAPAWVIWTYNRLVRRRNRLAEAWSGIEVQLKRRHDLVPRLVTCVQAYRDHERSVLEAVVRARQEAQTVQNAHEAGPAEMGLTAQLRRLIAVAEAYPALQADANFRQLSAQLVATEDQLQYARRYYNGAVRDLNNLVESIPSLLVARRFGFKPAEYFAVESASERQAATVQVA